jgi:hypothetical protein
MRDNPFPMPRVPTNSKLRMRRDRFSPRLCANRDNRNAASSQRSTRYASLVDTSCDAEPLTATQRLFCEGAESFLYWSQRFSFGFGGCALPISCAGLFQHPRLLSTVTSELLVIRPKPPRIVWTRVIPAHRPTIRMPPDSMPQITGGITSLVYD